MQYEELYTEEQVNDLIEFHNRGSDYVVLDIETTGLDYHRDSITDVVISGRVPTSSCLFTNKFISALQRLQKPTVLHNFRFDFNMLYRAGVDLRTSGLLADTMLMDHLLDENQEHHTLDAIIQRRFKDSYKEKFWSEFKEYKDAPRHRQVEYACMDVVYTARVYEALKGDLAKQGVPDSLIKHVHDLALALYQTELSGIKLDLDYLSAKGRDLTEKITLGKGIMREAAPLAIEAIELDQYLLELDKRKTDKGKANVKRPVFNFDSVAQLGNLLYGELGLPEQRNKQKKRTVDDAALERIETMHPIVGKIREYRGNQKVFTSFIAGSLKKMRNGRIYPSFNVNGAVTGRISSSDPNLQQLPKDGGVRGIYIPDPGRIFLSADYKQLEVTLAAHFSRDANLLRIVNENASQHDITAQGLGVSRATAKTINFAMQYGAGVQKIQKILSCSPKDAEHALNKYWETYSGLRKLIDRCNLTIEEGKPIINPFGRRRRFPTYQQVKEQYGNQGFFSKAENKYIYKRDLVWAGYQRQATNSLIQGTGADCASYSLYTINNKLQKAQIGKTVLSVHDEIIATCPEAHAEQCARIIEETMVEVGRLINLTVPLGVDCSKPMIRWEKS